MCSRIGNESMMNLTGVENAVELTIDFVEEFFCPAVENDIECIGFQGVDDIDNGMLLPTLLVVGILPEAVRHMPDVGEGNDIYSATCGSGIGKQLWMAYGKPEGSMSSHA